MKPATARARLLRRKLAALAARGVNGERDAALAKLARLEARFDFTGPDNSCADIFAGVFIAAPGVAQRLIDTPADSDIANAVKWSIEARTRIPCVYRAGAIHAEATPSTVRQLRGIAETISRNFGELWTRYQTAPGVQPADRAPFILGLYEGMMNETRENQPLPARPALRKVGRASRRAVAFPAGINAHPYTIAHRLGEQIRLTVTLESLTADLDHTITKHLNPSPP